MLDNTLVDRQIRQDSLSRQWEHMSCSCKFEFEATCWWQSQHLAGGVLACHRCWWCNNMGVFPWLTLDSVMTTKRHYHSAAEHQGWRSWSIPGHSAAICIPGLCTIASTWLANMTWLKTHIHTHSPEEPLWWSRPLQPAPWCCSVSLSRGGERNQLIAIVISWFLISLRGVNIFFCSAS